MAQGTYVCAWCETSSVGEAIFSCPSCGAPVDIKRVVDGSGWSELPAINDMAHLELGKSSCQIEGNYVPVADLNLAAGDGVYFTHHVLLWRDPSVKVTTMSLKGGWKRLFAGLPLIMTQAHGPGHIAFSHDHPGEMVALPLQAGHTIDVREHVLILATSNVAYDWFQTNVWFTTRSGNERETHYPIGMFMDRFKAGKDPGLVLIHGAGNVFIRKLDKGESILVKPTALLYKDTTVQMQLHFEHPASKSGGGSWLWRSWGNRYLWLRLKGPGRVAVQSAYKHMHDPGYTMVQSSPSTAHQW
ncbi:MAG: AIM24 family protein [Acidobacteriota bacterium]